MKYFKTLKEELILWFGTIEAINVFDPNSTFLKSLEGLRIDFFKD